MLPSLDDLLLFDKLIKVIVLVLTCFSAIFLLFDEKIAGSFHFTPGQAYEEADNGNRSTVHWDMVTIQRKDYGGGEVFFDGKLIRKDGIFLPKNLAKLNG